MKKLNNIYIKHLRLCKMVDIWCFFMDLEIEKQDKLNLKINKKHSF